MDAFIRGNHHLTLSVGPAQEDYDFHTGTLGLYSVKKTVLFDGTLPIYHLYYGSRAGDASTLLTTFPFRQAGVMGRRGGNQTKILNLSVPDASLGYWRRRLAERGVETKDVELHGLSRLHFAHPCGIEYALVGEPQIDDRAPYEGSDVPAEHAIRGTHGVTISVRDADEMCEFVENGLRGRPGGADGASRRFDVATSGYGGAIEILHEPDLPQASWRFGEGVVHHVAYDVGDPDTQQRAKDWLEGLGYTDCSERKDRQYFYSVYMRSPGGALIELAYSRPEGFTIDEPYEKLGSDFMLPPQFEDRRDEIMGRLETIDRG